MNGMKEIVIRFMPKLLDTEMYQVYVPIKGELIPFNFFDKGSAFRFATSLIDGEFTDAEIESLFKSPAMPKKPKRERVVSQSSLPLSEREPNAWTSTRRWKVVHEAITGFGGEAFTSTDLYHEAKRQGDKTSQATYLSMVRRLEKQGYVARLSLPTDRPQRFRRLPEFPAILPVHTPKKTHKQTRKVKRLTGKGEEAV